MIIILLIIMANPQWGVQIPTWIIVMCAIGNFLRVFEEHEKTKLIKLMLKIYEGSDDE